MMINYFMIITVEVTLDIKKKFHFLAMVVLQGRFFGRFGLSGSQSLCLSRFTISQSPNSRSIIASTQTILINPKNIKYAPPQNRTPVQASRFATRHTRVHTSRWQCKWLEFMIFHFCFFERYSVAK